ncbi:MAG: hypothetical protein AAGA55_09440, partial [Planctomycetota bacterium]
SIGSNRPTVLQRSIASLVLAGRPATGALMLLDHLDRASGDLGIEESRWIRGVGSIDPIGDAVYTRLGQLIQATDRTLSQRRQILRASVRGWPDLGEASSLLRAARAPARSPVIAGELLLRTDPALRASVCLNAIEQDPMLARAFGSAWSRLDPEAASTARTLIAGDKPASIMLGMGISLEIGNADGAAKLVSDPVNPLLDASLVAEMCGLLGQWSDADRWLALAADQASVDPDRRPYLLGALLGTARLAQAGVLAETIESDRQSTNDDFLAAAEAAFLVGDDTAVQTRIQRAGAIDPYDERVLERKLNFANANAELDGGTSLRAFGRELAELRPRGALFALLRARDLGGRGRIRDAADLIVSVGQREPARDLGVLLLAQAARTAATQGDDATVTMVTDWLRRRADLLPGSVPTAIAYAQTLAVSDPEAALAFLDDAYARIGHDELARAGDALFADTPALASEGALSEPAHRVLARTIGRAGTVQCIERISALVQVGDLRSAYEAASTALPEGGSLSEEQMARWEEAVVSLARANAGQPGNALEPGELAQLVDRAEAGASAIGIPVAQSLAQMRLLALAQAGDTVRLDAMIRDLAFGEDSGLVVVQALLAAEKTAEGIDLLGRLAVRDPSPDETLVDEWARLVGAAGDHRNVRVFLARLDETRLSSTAGLLRERFGLPGLPGTGGPDRDRADIAYACALIASVFARDEPAEDIYRLVLEFDAEHAWARNDLGYALAERGVMLEEAERLTSRSVELLGDRASVLDSLAWVRYKLGLLDDERDGADIVTREGAVSLLLRAVELEDGRENPTIRKHLGDALWRAGRTEDAITAWTLAQSLLRSRANEIAASDNPGGRASTETADQLNAVGRRLEDVKNDRTPRVEPLGEGIPDPLRHRASPYD